MKFITYLCRFVFIIRRQTNPEIPDINYILSGTTAVHLALISHVYCCPAL